MCAGANGGSQRAEVEALAVFEAAGPKENAIDVPFGGVLEEFVFRIAFENMAVRGDVPLGETGFVFLMQRHDPIFHARGICFLAEEGTLEF